MSNSAVYSDESIVGYKNILGACFQIKQTSLGREDIFNMLATEWSNLGVGVHVRTSAKVQQNKSEETKQNRSFFCALCDLSFQYRKDRDNHQRCVHGMNKEVGYHCYQCGRVCKFPVEFKRHLLSHSNQRAFSCSHCENRYKTEKSLKRHMAMLCEKHICSVCGKMFSSIHSLLHHNESVHTKKNIFKCEQCVGKFYTKKCLARHVKSVHEKHLSAPVRCNLCEKEFASNRLMTSHKRRQHSGSGFTCNDCSAVFKYKQYLRAHIQTRHLPPTYKCTRCLKMFHSYQDRQIHLRRAHAVDNRPVFLCPECGKRLKNKDGLVNHQKIHSGEKPHVCEVCGKSFRTFTNLNQHSHTHSDMRPFKCGLCDKAFRIKHHLRQHMATHGMASLPKYGRQAKRDK